MTQQIEMTKDIEVSRDGAVMSAAFARPQKKNAITGAMYEALIEAFEDAERDPSVGAFVLSGKGGVFTAGNDLGDFVALATGAAAANDGRDFPAGRFTRKLAEFEKPLIAAVDGLAVGIGTTLCFHCDLVYATPEARFQMPFVNLGLVPEAGSSLLAPQRFGRAKAAEFLLLAEPFDAAGARARPRQRDRAAGRAHRHAMAQGGGARGQASRGSPSDAAPHARRRRDAEGPHGR